MDFLIHLHSGLRWIVLIALLLAIVNAFKKYKKGKYGAKDKVLNLVAMAVTHTQILIGFVLYFTSARVSTAYSSGAMMKNAEFRFVAIEHLVAMVLAAVLITIGHKKSKTATFDRAKHRKVATLYLIALVLIVVSIPWPGRFSFGGWF